MHAQVAAEWAWWIGLLLGAVPLLALAVWHCNDVGHCAAFAMRRWGRHRRASLPPGHMGLPFVGESLALLWYFKLARRPDGFVDARRRRYGAGGAGGVYRTHLFGSPTVLVCSPAANKFVLQSSQGGTFGIRWPAPELVGVSCVVNVDGSQHARLRGFILAAINRPGSLRTIAEVVQPRVVAALRSWADKGTIAAATEIKKVTFENICKMFVSMDPSPLTDMIDGWFAGLVAGFRAFPLDLPGTAYRHARDCRRKLDAVFREELQRRRKETTLDVDGDLMSGLMRMEDEQGKKLCDDEVVDNIVSLVVAGYESTSNAIMWAAYHLAKSPHALRKLREENESITRDKNGGFITLDDIPSMKYTAKVVEETIRVANVAPMVHRVAHRDVENHRKPGTYQVFGGGPRICAGNMLARLQLTIMLHHLAVGYKWELLNPDAEVTYLPHSKAVDGAVMSFSKLSSG
ncbi:ent-kaurenoic acid oxidase 1-like [Panicum miliaceum]|uniref:Ent-kaurenoic acid oxidase 1-like n=1 Tax=Panicum miliaceum TaxID=4540 RepID=A0A3L6SA25_PANMI|nr:ent-kaurenoic acid oxidase 1-like [Panicum miliaceum]